MEFRVSLELAERLGEDFGEEAGAAHAQQQHLRESFLPDLFGKLRQILTVVRFLASPSTNLASFLRRTPSKEWNPLPTSDEPCRP